MTEASGPNPSNEHQGRLPRRHWEAAVRPHWVEIVLAVALIVVGGAQVCIYLRQAGIMQTQADIAKGQLEITERQFAPRLVMNNLEDADEHLTQWFFTPQWLNKGEFGAMNVRNWDDVRFFPGATPSSFDFLAVPPGVESSGVPELPGGESITQRTLAIPRTWAQQSFNGQGNIVAWGYIKWDSPPPNVREYSRRWCFLLTFEMSKADLAMKLPRYYQPNCNSAAYR